MENEYKQDLYKRLKDPKYALEYLKETLNQSREEENAIIINAVTNIIKAMGSVENEESEMPEGFERFKRPISTTLIYSQPNKKRVEIQEDDLNRAAELLAEMAEALEWADKPMRDIAGNPDFCINPITKVLKKFKGWK